ncbi:hypothetical protein GUJ93_ZPchr0005g14533 [Zizania palustris]|uniref:Uncharacterized protein n=1 Tax=Zizania palustris TaxID=103762 RepID=A0A8J5SAX2_ZIZPA|nr:hypothetical protein GUJ93_ZPchr0005g14533 [Zizania palustris]
MASAPPPLVAPPRRHWLPHPAAMASAPPALATPPRRHGLHPAAPGRPAPPPQPAAMAVRARAVACAHAAPAPWPRPRPWLRATFFLFYNSWSSGGQGAVSPTITSILVFARAVSI